MGRIKTKQVKGITKKLMKEYRSQMTDNFEKNKLVVNELVESPSLKIRNTIAGYVTRLVKSKKDF